MAKTEFDDLIATALGEGEGARLLLLLLRADRTEGGGVAPAAASGTLTPWLANDIELTPQVSWASVLRDVESLGQSWDMAMVSVLTDPTGRTPSGDAAEPYLKKMADDVIRGRDLSGYALFDRAGERHVVSRRR